MILCNLPVRAVSLDALQSLLLGLRIELSDFWSIRDIAEILLAGTKQNCRSLINVGPDCMMKAAQESVQGCSTMS